VERIMMTTWSHCAGHAIGRRPGRSVSDELPCCCAVHICTRALTALIRGSGSSRRVSLRCSYCGKSGHNSKACPHNASSGRRRSLSDDFHLD
jgi:hypothetical protein